MARKELQNVLFQDDPEGPRAPLVLDSPHTGRLFPEDFRPAIAMEICNRVNDWFIEDLFGDANRNGAVLIQALFRRAYIDPNRDTADLDLDMVDGDWPDPVSQTEKTRRGASLIWKLIDGETQIYDRKLSVEEVKLRIDTYWRPYHAALKTALDDTHAAFGRVLHINCHSMPEMGDERWGDSGQRRADFIVGTRDGTTAGAAFTDTVVAALGAQGHSVAVNEKFKGVELIKRYSDPAAGRESLQIEVNRGIYMDEANILPNAQYDATKAVISEMIARVAKLAQAR